MKLELNKEQFETLILSVCYATECLDDQEPNPMGERFMAMLEFLAEQAPEMGYKVGKELMEEGDSLILHPNFVKSVEGFMELYEEHREDVFWSELLARMVGKQLRRKFGANFDARKVSQKEQDKIWEKMEIELAENGIENLVIKGM